MTACRVCACENFLPADRESVPPDCLFYVEGEGLCAHCMYEAGAKQWLSGLNRLNRRIELKKLDERDGKTLKLILELEKLLTEEQDLIARVRLKVQINSLYFGIKRPRKYDTDRNRISG